MNEQQQSKAIKRQQWIKDRCILIENQFNGRLGPEGFAVRLLLGTALLLYWYRELQLVDGLPGYISWVLLAAGIYYAMLTMAHRFHDIGLGAANMLQVILPLLVWYKMATRLPPDYYMITTMCLFAWPVLVLLRLCFQDGLDGATGFEKR